MTTHTMHTDALSKLGSVLTEADNVGRDAIHLAVEPLIAGERLEPGQEIGFQGNDRTKAYATGHGLGIVDPFLKRHVQEGERFFMVLHPRTITSLRHVWEHPGFVPPPPTGAQKRMADFADAEVGDSVSNLLIEAENYLKSDETMNLGDNEGAQVYTGFWKDFEELTGIPAVKGPGTYDAGKRADDTPYGDESFFSCSC